MVLALSDTTDLEKLAQLADKIVEVATPSISAATRSSSEINHLPAEIAELKRIVESLHIPNRPQCSSSRGRTPRRSQATTPADDDTTDRLCWYH